MSQVTEQSGLLKWYNKYDGYGFVFVEALGKDALLHKSCISEAHELQLKKNALIQFKCVTGHNGLLSVHEIISITEPQLAWQDGVTKWFDSSAGFGFVVVTAPDGTSVDVFVHATIAKKLGKGLLPGDKVQVVLAGGGARLRADEIKFAT